MTGALLSVLLLLAPVVTESGRFTIRQNGKSIGTEEFSIRTRDKGFTVEGRTRLDGDPTMLTSRMELDENLVPVSYEYSRGKGAIRVVVDPKSSSELIVTENGKSSETNFHFPPSASIVDNNFFHHYILLMYRVKSSEQTIAIFVPQDMQVGLAKVKSTGKNTYTIEIGSVKAEATVDENGRLLKMAV